MTDNDKIFVQQIPNVAAATKPLDDTLSKDAASKPQTNGLAEKHPVPVSTVNAPKVGGTNKKSAAAKPQWAPKPLTENSSLYEAFGPEAVQFLQETEFRYEEGQKPHTLNTKLKDVFGIRTPNMLAILEEEQAPSYQTPPKPQPAVTPPAKKKIMVTKAEAESLAKVKSFTVKSTLEEVFGSKDAKDTVDAIKTRAVERIIEQASTRAAAAKPAVKKAVPPVAAPTVKKPVLAAKPAVALPSAAKKPLAAKPVTANAPTPAAVKKPAAIKPSVVPAPHVAKPPESFTTWKDASFTPSELARQRAPKISTSSGRGVIATNIFGTPIRNAQGQLYMLPKMSPSDPDMRSDGQLILKDYGRPWSELTKQEQDDFNKKWDEETKEHHEKLWKSRGIDPNDKTAQAAWDKANPNEIIERYKKRNARLGLRIDEELPGYFEKLSDKQINKFLAYVGAAWTVYAYPNTIYYVLAAGITIHSLVILYKYLKINHRIKFDFRPDPKSRNSEAYDREVHERLQARKANKDKAKKQ